MLHGTVNVQSAKGTVGLKGGALTSLVITFAVLFAFGLGFPTEQRLELISGRDLRWCAMLSARRGNSGQMSLPSSCQSVRHWAQIISLKMTE